MLKNAAVVPVLLVCWSASYAWTSGPEQSPGPPQARLVLTWGRVDLDSLLVSVPVTTPNEHAELLAQAMYEAGLPSSLFPDPSSPFFATVFTDATANVPLLFPASPIPSVNPVTLSAATGRQTRAYTLPGFASLPDHSYALWDWATGNETCPGDTVDPNAGTDSVTCHTFSKHLGPLNSAHFPPQSLWMYKWYHDVALQRADACSTLYTFLSSDITFWNSTDAKPIKFVQECEREALSIEAVGQHYLQDNWAMGHMWQRWGGPTLASYSPVFPYATCALCFSQAEDERERAVVIGLFSGIIHGADAVERDFIPKAPFFPYPPIPPLSPYLACD